MAWVAEIPVPYRVGLYQRIREEAGIDLKLFFCAATQKDRDWSVDLSGVPHVVLPGITVAIKPREQFFLRMNPLVWRELALFDPDAVVVGGYAHLTMQWAMLWCRWNRKPYLVNSESHHRRAPGGLLRAMKRLPVRFYIRGAAACLPAGSLAREYLLSYGGRADRMFSLPNTCDVRRFAELSRRARADRPALRSELGLGLGPVTLYVGRLTEAKGLDTLLQGFAMAARRCGNARPQLLLVGEGEQRGALEALAVGLKIHDSVRFAGSRPWIELPRLYAAADVFVLPSRFEPWGAVVNEAMACGLPIVATDHVGCAPDLVSPGENGWVVPTGDTQALANALTQALADEARLSTMGVASARRVEAWGEDACLESFVRAVEAVVERA